MTGREQVRFTCPCHRTCPPFVQSSLYRPTNINSPPPLFFYCISFHPVQQPIFHLGRNFLKFLQFRVKLEIWRNATVLSTLENLLPFQIPKSFSSPFRDRPSFPSIHPSTISSFPICHARCVVSFSSPIATLVDRRAGHERRRSQVEEEEKGDGGKRDEMWSAMGTHEGRNGTCWTSRCHWPEPAPASRKRDEKEEKGELGKMRGQVQPETILAARVILSSHRSPSLYIEIIRLISLLLSILSVFFGKDKCNDACDSLTLCFVLLYTSD